MFDNRVFAKTKWFSGEWSQKNEELPPSIYLWLRVTVIVSFCQDFCLGTKVCFGSICLILGRSVSLADAEFAKSGYVDNQRSVTLFGKTCFLFLKLKIFSNQICVDTL